jgi:hypothetical protein
MALSKVQYQVLFNNAFGAESEAFGLAIDDSGGDAVGKVGNHTVQLLVIQDRALEWRIDGQTFAPWKMHTPDSPERQVNGENLRAALAG